jgi:hypothetical protein
MLATASVMQQLALSQLHRAQQLQFEALDGLSRLATNPHLALQAAPLRFSSAPTGLSGLSGPATGDTFQRQAAAGAQNASASLFGDEFSLLPSVSDAAGPQSLTETAQKERRLSVVLLFSSLWQKMAQAMLETWGKIFKRDVDDTRKTLATA